MDLRYTKIFFLFAIIFLLSCNRKSIPSSSKVNYLTSKDGSITMRSIGIGENQEAAIADAEKNAFDVLFFRGLPESEQKIALIDTDEIKEKQKHQSYFENFYKYKRYKTFLMSSIPVASLTNIKGGLKSIAVDIKINITALRKDLEQNDIIRKFGY
ncbi:MAG TPA: hypothetical protein DCQ29_01185 [Chitinophagaceae bacterium]|nr:hypothetical protein [Chitinophagaceae bacterium]